MQSYISILFPDRMESVSVIMHEHTSYIYLYASDSFGFEHSYPYKCLHIFKALTLKFVMRSNLQYI